MKNNTTSPRLATFVKALETNRQAQIESLSVRGSLRATMPVPGCPGHQVTLQVEPNRSGTLDERSFVATIWSHRKGQALRASEKTLLGEGQPLSLGDLDDELGSELAWAAFHASSIPVHREPRRAA